MPFIEVVRPNGTCYQTTEKVGSLAEKNYFTVITERWGKLFFTSQDYYNRWVKEGRRQNSINGCITSAKYYFDSSFEGNDDLMIVEAYHVGDDAPTASPATPAPTASASA